MKNLSNKNLANKMANHKRLLTMFENNWKNKMNIGRLSMFWTHHTGQYKLARAEMARRARNAARSRRTATAARRSAAHWLHKTRTGTAMRPPNRGGSIYRRAKYNFNRRSGAIKNASTSPKRHRTT
jgi:hypothetical protein